MKINVSGNFFADSERSAGRIPTGVAFCERYFADYDMTCPLDPFDLAPDEAVSTDGSIFRITLPAEEATVDFLQHCTVPEGLLLTAAYPDGSDADLSALQCAAPITTVALHLRYADNAYIAKLLTLKITRTLPAGTELLGLSASRGRVYWDSQDGMWHLLLPAEASYATLSMTTKDGATAALYLGDRLMSRVTGVARGATRKFTIRVTNGTAVGEHILCVTRQSAATAAVDYAECAKTAYVIDSDWVDLCEGDSVEFYFRGQIYIQDYDPDRHFATYDAAYAHWLASEPDILHDTPVFLLTEGTYGSMTYSCRAVFLGANAGINPNDPDADVAALKPGDDIAANPAWSTTHETILTGGILRTTRVDGAMTDLSLMRTVQAAEDAAGEEMEFYLVADGLTLTGDSVKFCAHDADEGNWQENGQTVTIRGHRRNSMYLQNLRCRDMTGLLYRAWDTSWNYNSLTLSALRITGQRSKALLQKYLDTLVMDGVYLSDSTLSSSLFDVDGSMNPHHDLDYTIRNCCFVNNNLVRVVRLSASAYGDYEKGRLEISGNAFLETAGNQWGYFALSGTLPNWEISIHDNLFCQDGSYNGVTVTTAIEGNPSFYTYPMTLQVHRNRFIGMQTCLPNLDGVSDAVLAKLRFDFNDNYLADSFTAVSDINGKRPAYCSAPEGNVDPILSDAFSYYLDYALTRHSADLNITGVNFAGWRADYTVEGSAITVVLGRNAEGRLHFFTASDAVVQTLTRNGTPVQTISYAEVLAGADDYVLTLTVGDTSVSYQVTLVPMAYPEFAKAFTDPEISASALMLHPAVAGQADGTQVTAQWRGTTYCFTVGENIFSDMASLTAARPAGHLQILLPSGTFPDLVIPADTTVYGVNYDINPNVPGSDISEDWSKNPLWGTYGESRTGSISVAAEAEGTSVTVKGITLGGYFSDSHRPVSARRTQVTLENTVISHTQTLSVSTGSNYTWYALNFVNANTLNNSRNRDIGVLRNLRVEKVMCTTEISNGRNRLLCEYLPADFTMEGVYCDMTASGVGLFGWWKMANGLKSGVLNILNCNFRNGIQTTADGYLYFEGRNKAVNIYGTGAVLNLRGNCFYNTQQNYNGMVIYPYAYSRINITDNLFLSTTAKTTEFFRFDNTETAGECTDILHIYGNRFVGVSNQITNPATNEVLDLSGNYAADYTADYQTASTTKYLIGDHTTNAWYYLNYALTSTSDGHTANRAALNTQAVQEAIVTAGGSPAEASVSARGVSLAPGEALIFRLTSHAAVELGAAADAAGELTLYRSGSTLPVQRLVVRGSVITYRELNADDGIFVLCNTGSETVCLAALRTAGSSPIRLECNQDICVPGKNLLARLERNRQRFAQFSDLKEDWYLDGVRFAAETGLMQGTGETTFRPDGIMTRAMLVTVLWRMADSPKPDAASGFADVSAESYYAVVWAVENGITTGVSKTAFAPQEALTRVDLTVFLYRYAAWSEEGDELSGFADGGTVPEYGRNAMSWAVAQGLIVGVPAGDGAALCPFDAATRAQCALILARFCTQN